MRTGCLSCGSTLEGMHYSFCILMQGGTMGPYEQRNIPSQEQRGGKRVDWANAKPGEPLPELPPDAYPEPDSERLPDPPGYVQPPLFADEDLAPRDQEEAFLGDED